MFTVGNKCWTPDSMQFGQGVITDIQDGDVKVAHFDIHGRKSEKWFSGGVVQAVPTKEQLEVQASNTFRARHLNDFNPCAANVQLITSWVRTHSMAWTADGLEQAYAALKGRLAPMPAPGQQATPAAPAAPAPAAPVTPAPSAPVFSLTKRQVAVASKGQMRSWMADEPKGAVAALEALGIKTTLPARWRQ